jgi:uncharacterized DUF497 family protein
MRLTFDPAKNALNIERRGLAFELVGEIDWNTALLRDDARRDYGECRVRVLGFIGPRLHVAIVTYRGDNVHVISLRKANRKEVVFYEQEIGSPR